MDKNLEVLKEICKGVKMGMDAISYVKDKVEDENFRDTLTHEYSMYNNILDKLFQNIMRSTQRHFNCSVSQYDFVHNGVGIRQRLRKIPLCRS